MAITVNCACGKKLVVKEEMAGRKVRCPACDRVQTAPSYSADPPGRGDYEDDIPQRKARRRYGDAPKKSNTALWIGVGAGVRSRE